MNDAAQSPPGGSYRKLVASPGWRRLTVTSGFQRLPVAMAPIALVLAGHAATGSFKVGALMASAYTFADAGASPWSGRLIDRMELRRGVSLQMGAAAVLLTALAFFAAARFPDVVLIAASVLAGAAPAGVMGGLRTYLQRIVSPELKERAFALDATVLELEWMCAPALVAVTGYLGVPVLAVTLMAAASAGALGAARTLQPQRPAATPGTRAGAWRNHKAIPVYAQSAAMGYAEGTINIALAPLMVLVGARPATAGLLLALLSLTSAAGGFAYGALANRIPGTTAQRADFCLLALGVFTIPIGLAPSVAVAAGTVAACGLWLAPLVTLRTLILGQVLPTDQQSEGFSTLSAAMQAGYATSGITTGILLSLTSARSCFLIAGAVAAASGVTAVAVHQVRLAGHSNSDKRPT